jgi:hypothetical protein
MMMQYLIYSDKIMQGINIKEDMQFLLQTEQVHNFPQYFCAVYFNIILPPMPATSLQVSPQKLRMHFSHVHRVLRALPLPTSWISSSL